MRSWALSVLCVGCGLMLAGCPKGSSEYAQGRKAEALQDYDTALEHYQRALRQDPTNTEYKIKTSRIRFEAGQFHVNQGQKLREKGELQQALSEFQRAMAIDPASPIAEQETRRTIELLATKAREAEGAAAPPKEDRKSTRLNSSHIQKSRMPSSA